MLFISADLIKRFQRIYASCGEWVDTKKQNKMVLPFVSTTMSVYHGMLKIDTKFLSQR